MKGSTPDQGKRRSMVNRDTGRIELVARNALYEYDICLSWCDLRLKLTHA